MGSRGQVFAGICEQGVFEGARGVVGMLARKGLLVTFL